MINNTMRVLLVPLLAFLMMAFVSPTASAENRTNTGLITHITVDLDTGFVKSFHIDGKLTYIRTPNEGSSAVLWEAKNNETEVTVNSNNNEQPLPAKWWGNTITVP